MIRGRLLAAVAAGTAAELSAVALIASAAWLIARAGQHPPLSALALAIVAVRAFALFRGVFRYTERLVGHDAALRALAELRVRVYEALRRSPRTVRRDADVVQRMVADVESIQDLLLRCLLPAAISGAVTVAAIGLVTTVLPGAGAVLALGLLIAGLGLPALGAALSRTAARRAAAARIDLAVHGLDVARGAEDLAAFGATERFVTRAEDAAARLARLERRTAEPLISALGTAVQALTTAGVALAAMRQGADGVLTAVVTLTSLVAVEAVLPLADAARRLTELLPGARRVGEILSAEPDRAAGHRPVPSGVPGIELVRVRVAYGGTVALDGVDLRIPAGHTIAVVGASGAGKSTLLGVLSGEIRPDSGAVLLGDAPLQGYDPADVRAAVRGMGQDAHVFGASVRVNVALARPDAPMADLEEAARRTRLLDWIRSLPEGWDTYVDSARLSGGQRQRLLLARALLADPPVLVLDEPAEGLDLGTADAIVADLLSDHRTVVLVTHRLAPLTLVDEVAVLDRGRIVQRGAHADLLARPGPYRGLWEAEEITRPE